MIQDIDYYIRGFTSSGIRVFPLQPRSKTPATAHGVKDATLDGAIFGPKWEDGCNIAIATGGVVDVIDCDSVGCAIEFARRLSGEDVDCIEHAADICERLLGPVVYTARGAHIYCLSDGARKNGAHIIQLGDGWVDYRTSGGYVVAPPSIHPSGAEYRFHTAYFAPKAPAPDWVWSEKPPSEPPSEQQILPVVPMETPDRYFDAVMERNLSMLAAAQKGCRNQTLNTAAFNMGQVASSLSQQELAYSQLHDVARSIGLSEHETVETIRSGMTAGMQHPKQVQRDEPHITVAQAKKTERQLPKKPTLSDYASTILAEYPGMLGYDLFASRIRKMYDQPGEPQSRHGVDRWEDIDQAVLAANLAELLGRDIAADTLSQAVHLAAHRNELHPVRDYLRRCREKWDGRSRLRAMLQALGAAETKAHRLELALWLAGAAARGMSDGSVKLDSMLILEGPQGIGKSTVVKILGGEWAMDTPLDLDQPKEAYMQLAGCWVCEWPELSSFVKTTPEKLKAFLSKEYDDFRPPYGRNMVRLVRHCAFIGTTNDDMYLRDDTGNRRFWPIRCGRCYIDFEWLRANRDQLWGEAVELCDAYTKRGKGFAPAPGTEAEILAAQVQTRQQMDELADKLVSYVQEQWDRAYSRKDGVFITLEQVQAVTTFHDYKQKTLKKALESIGGEWTRRATAATVDYTDGEGRLIPAERHRGCVFQVRPSYAGEYDDKNFGDIEIPTEK